MHKDYETLDLSGVFNSDLSFFEDAHEVELGRRILHGLPFAFGDRESAACVLRIGSAETIRLPLPVRVDWLIFAHAVLETDLFSGGAVGDVCATYALVFSDGSQHAVPIRQRYEIGPTPRKWTGRPIPLDWGQTPFLAMPDTEQRLMHRSHGRYDEAGARLVEIEDPQSRMPYVLPYRFYVWAMRNPYPGKELSHLILTGGGRTTIIGAITAGLTDEEPFGRQVADDLLVELDRPVTEATEIAIDRGVSTYMHAAVAASEAGDLPGWGTARRGVRTGFASIAGSPSATLVVREADEEVGRVRFGDLEAGNPVEAGPGLRVTRVNRSRTWLRITVADAATGELLACRIHMRTSDGIPVAPYGHHTPINSGGGTWNLDIGGDVRIGGRTYAAIDGECEGWVPVGELTVELACGFEYRSVETVVTIAPGQKHLALTLVRIADMAAVGYAAGDTHLHFISSQGAELEARCEGVAVANLLLSQWGQHYSSKEEFTGRPRQSNDRRVVVYAGQENRSNMLGHIHLLGMRRQIVPWCTGGAEEAAMGGGLETMLSHWADECHAQGGIVILAHFPVPNGEIAAMIATGRADAIEMIAHDPYNVGEYYRYLNAGYRLPIVGGTDKMTADVAVGQIRTYARIADARTPDYAVWLEAIKCGDCFVTSGPLLQLSADQRPPGSELVVRSGQRLRIRADAVSIFPLARLELVVNGEVVHCEAREGVERIAFEIDLPIKEASWLAVRCFAGPIQTNHHDVWQRPIMGHTSPIYVGVDGPYRRFDANTLKYMQALTDGIRLHVTERARRHWPGPVWQRHEETDHLAYLLRPLDEALAAIRNRLEAGQ